MVIGESKPHGPVEAAQTIDNMGSLFITERLARDSLNGTLEVAIDDWLVSYDASPGNITLLDNATNLIIVGSPRINVLSYYYNNLRGPFGQPFVPVLFQVNSTESSNYLYVPTSGSIYGIEYDGQGRQVADYGVIMIFQDQYGRYVTLVYGLGAEGTMAACQVLRDYDQWNLHSSGVIVKSYNDTLRNYARQISIVEEIG
jgi:hypothetical protein